MWANRDAALAPMVKGEDIVMQATEHRSFQTPDETRAFPNGRAEILRVGQGEVGRLVFEPGWRWSNDVKPIAKTNSCEAPHFQYHGGGGLALRMDEGTASVQSRA